jgi:hypothetical protein
MAKRLLRPTLRLAVGVSASAAVLLVAACDGGSSTAPPEAPDGGLGAACGARALQDECAACCGYTETVLQPYVRGFHACVCSQTCRAECASTVCAAAPLEADEACDTCLGKLETIVACEQPGNEECDKDPACKSFVACGNEAGCLDKPRPDAGSADGG